MKLLSERAKTGCRSCVTFHPTFVALGFPGFRTRQICTEHAEKRRNKFPLVNVRRSNSGLQHNTLHLSMPFVSQNPSLRMSTCSQETMEAMGSFEVLQDIGCDYGLRDDTIYALGNYRWSRLGLLAERPARISLGTV